MNHSTPANDKGTGQGRKRKEASPIAKGQDYSVLLRKQALSASPVLKRRKEVEVISSDDEEIIFNTGSSGIKKTTMGLDRSMEVDLSLIHI